MKRRVAFVCYRRQFSADQFERFTCVKLKMTMTRSGFHDVTEKRVRQHGFGNFRNRVAESVSLVKTEIFALSRFIALSAWI